MLNLLLTFSRSRSQLYTVQASSGAAAAANDSLPLFSLSHPPPSLSSPAFFLKPQAGASAPTPAATLPKTRARRVAQPRQELRLRDRPWSVRRAPAPCDPCRGPDTPPRHPRPTSRDHSPSLQMELHFVRFYSPINHSSWTALMAA